MTSQVEQRKQSLILGRSPSPSDVSAENVLSPAVNKQITVVTFDSFCDILLQFEYQVNREKLRIDEVFVQNFVDYNFRD